jgi:hypothetical protein
MTVRELINALSVFDPELEVRMDVSPEYPDFDEPEFHVEPNGKNGPYLEIYN